MERGEMNEEEHGEHRRISILSSGEKLSMEVTEISNFVKTGAQQTSQKATEHKT